jgi:hypothetical protein
LNRGGLGYRAAPLAISQRMLGSKQILCIIIELYYYYLRLEKSVS